MASVIAPSISRSRARVCGYGNNCSSRMLPKNSCLAALSSRSVAGPPAAVSAGAVDMVVLRGTVRGLSSRGWGGASAGTDRCVAAGLAASIALDRHRRAQRAVAIRVRIDRVDADVEIAADVVRPPVPPAAVDRHQRTVESGEDAGIGAGVERIVDHAHVAG